MTTHDCSKMETRDDIYKDLLNRYERLKTLTNQFVTCINEPFYRGMLLSFERTILDNLIKELRRDD